MCKGTGTSLPLKTYPPPLFLYYPLSTKMLTLFSLQTFPKFAVFFNMRPVKPCHTFDNKVSVD